jgi:excisionase family DNA binding protein
VVESEEIEESRVQMSDRDDIGSRSSATAGSTSPPKLGRLLTADETAALLRVSKPTIYRVARGLVKGAPRLAAVRIGGRVLFREESLARYVEALEQASMPESGAR